MKHFTHTYTDIRACLHHYEQMLAANTLATKTKSLKTAVRDLEYLLALSNGRSARDKFVLFDAELHPPKAPA